MSIECTLLISLLKLTKESPALLEEIKKDARLPSSVCVKLIEKLQSEELIYLKIDCAEIDSKSRLRLAVKAVSLGADIQHISDLLRWQEFEEIAAEALKNNGYSVYNNVRFKDEGHRYEIDVVGCRKPLVLCIDCKRWQRAITPSALKRIVTEQSQRTQALTNAIPNKKIDLECSQWGMAKFVPAVLSLSPSAFKFYDHVPIVPVLQLQDFTSQLPLQTENVKIFPKKFEKLTDNF